MWTLKISNPLIFLCLMATHLWAQSSETDPYQLEAPNGGELEKRLSGEYVLKLRDPVKISHGDFTIKAEEGWLYQTREQAVLRGNVVVDDGERKLFSDKAIYYKKQRQLILEGNVRIFDLERHLNADRVVYWRNSEEIEATGQVAIIDRKNDVEIQGYRAHYDDVTKIAEFDRTPRLTFRQKGQEPLYIDCEYLTFDAQKNSALAIDNVVITEKQSAAYCETAKFQRDQNRVVLEKNPVILYRDKTMQSEIGGDTITLQMPDNRLENALVNGQATVLHMAIDESGAQSSRVNVVSGDHIQMFFAKNSIRQVMVNGRARSIYYPELKSPDKPERNDVSGEQITLEISGGKVELVSVSGQCRGNYAFPKSVEKTDDDEK